MLKDWYKVTENETLEFFVGHAHTGRNGWFLRAMRRGNIDAQAGFDTKRDAERFAKVWAEWMK